jgi:hypothetical protein
MEYTISVTNGKQVARGHNRRDPEAIKRQDHILRGGFNEIWCDEPHGSAYHRIFDDSIKKYNEKQVKNGRKNRIIKNYYAKVANSVQQNPVYEVIVAIGNCNNNLFDLINKSILMEYCDEWATRNPNLVMVGAYYHADERDPETGKFGVSHLHIDYIPVAYKCNRGPEIQTSVTGALKEMGYVTYKNRHTAQMQWQEKEREALKQICLKHGVQVAPPQKEKRKHQDTQTYKAEQKAKDRLRETQEQLTAAQADLEQTKEYIADVWDKICKKLNNHGLTDEEIDKMYVNEVDESTIVVSVSDYINLKDTAKKAEEEQKKAAMEVQAKEKLNADYQQLLQQLNLERYKFEKANREKEKLQKAIGAYEKTIEDADPNLAAEAFRNFETAYYMDHKETEITEEEIEI